MSLEHNVDQIFADSAYPQKFSFTNSVANVFDNMAHRSIPLYQTMHEQMASWANRSYIPGTVLYDLGCSTGQAIVSVLRRADKPMIVVGVDNSESMITKAENNLSEFCQNHDIVLRTDSLANLHISEASFVGMNYTLQFVPVEQREKIIQNIYNALVNDGVLFFSEKIKAADAAVATIITEHYDEFKLGRGYSWDEIERKRKALEGVLIPLTYEENVDLLKNAGFRVVQPILQWNQFVTWIARK